MSQENSLYPYVDAGTTASFRLEGSLPILKETYVSAGIGTTILKGLFVPRAFMKTSDEASYRVLSARRHETALNKIVYPVVHLPDKTAIFALETQMFSHRERHNPPPLSFAATVDGAVYRFKRTPRLGRAFEIWDSMGTTRIIERERSTNKLLLDATIHDRVPALFVLLLPWLDNQPLT